MTRRVIEANTQLVNESDTDPEALAIFTARKHTASPSVEAHEGLMKCIIFQLDCALQSVGVQRRGLTLVYDMSGSSFAQFDYSLSRKLLQLLQAPLWFKGPLKIVSPFLKRKFLERLRLVEDISQHLPTSFLPDCLGGSRKFNHINWVMQCIECYKRSIEDNPPPPPRSPPGAVGNITVYFFPARVDARRASTRYDRFSTYIDTPISLRLVEDISQHLPTSFLPDCLGGSRKFNHTSWVMQCIECYKRSIEDNPPPPPRSPPGAV
eukprot:sb/3468306/